MTIRVICTATLLFFDANDKSKPQKLAPMLQIVELPDWVTETTTFRVNHACGRIKVLSGSLETKAVEVIQENTQDLTARQQSENLEKEISKMKKAELQEYCKAHNIEYKADATNPELIDLIKSTVK